MLDENAATLEAADRLLSSSAENLTGLQEISYDRALALSRLGRNDEAEAAWALLAASPEDEYGARAAVSLAESQLRSGNAEKARHGRRPHKRQSAPRLLARTRIYSA